MSITLIFSSFLNGVISKFSVFIRKWPACFENWVSYMRVLTVVLLRFVWMILSVWPLKKVTIFTFFPGGGIMTLHDYGYLPPGFLKSYPVSEWNFHIYTLPWSLAFFRGFFGIYCYANFLCYANFSIVFYCFKTNCFWGRGKFLRQIAWGKSQQSAEQCIKTQKNHRKELFSKETLTNSCTVCHNITMNMLKTSKLGLISWTKDNKLKPRWGYQTVLWIGTLARIDLTNFAPCFRVRLEKRHPVSDSKAKKYTLIGGTSPYGTYMTLPPPPGLFTKTKFQIISDHDHGKVNLSGLQ